MDWYLWLALGIAIGYLIGFVRGEWHGRISVACRWAWSDYINRVDPHA